MEHLGPHLTGWGAAVLLTLKGIWWLAVRIHSRRRLVQPVASNTAVTVRWPDGTALTITTGTDDQATYQR